MGESFLIFFGIIAGIALVLALIFGAVLLRNFIFAAITLAISAGIFYGGLSLLINVGGPPGAFGLFLMLPGAFFGWLGILSLKAGLKDLEDLRR